VVVFEKFSGLDLIEFLNFKDAYERHQLGFGYFLFFFKEKDYFVRKENNLDRTVKDCFSNYLFELIQTQLKVSD
jgi:hypothetical protein